MIVLPSVWNRLCITSMRSSPYRRWGSKTRYQHGYEGRVLAGEEREQTLDGQ